MNTEFLTGPSATPTTPSSIWTDGPYQMPTEPPIKKANHVLRWIGGGVVALMLIGAAAGANHTTSTSTPSDSPSVVTSPSADLTGTSPENALLAQLATSEFASVYASEPDSTLLSIGHETCTQLAGGATKEDLAAAAMLTDASGTTLNAMAYLMGAAVGQLCPQYNYKVS